MTAAAKRRHGRALLRTLAARAAEFEQVADGMFSSLERTKPLAVDEATRLVRAAFELFTAARDIVLHHEPRQRTKHEPLSG